MKIESERLFLYPVSNEELQRRIDAEKDDDLKQAYAEMLQGCIREPEKRVWNAVWYLELKKQSGVIVGELGFKGLGEDGTVEIGYGLREGYCGKGLMREAVKAVSDWALSQEGVTQVEAETAPNNEASQKVLSAVGYVPLGQWGEEGPRYVYRG